MPHAGYKSCDKGNRGMYSNPGQHETRDTPSVRRDRLFEKYPCGEPGYVDECVAVAVPGLAQLMTISLS